MPYYAIALTYILGCALLHTSLDLKQKAGKKIAEPVKNYAKNIFLLLAFELLALFCRPDDLYPREIMEHMEGHAGLSFILLTVFGLMLLDSFLAVRKWE